MEKLKDLGFESVIELEQFLETVLLNERKSFNEISEMVNKKKLKT